MIKSKEDILEEIKKEALENHVPILRDDALKFISLILQIAKPDKILEIGTAVGYSAINFSKYFKDENSKILSIEINENMYKKATENIHNMNLDKSIQVVLADATEYLGTMDETKEQFDVVFIDAAKGQYVIFLENAIRLVKPGGIIIADNVYFNGRVLNGYNEHKFRTAVTRLKKYIEIINTDERLSSSIFDIGDGVAVSVVKSK